MKRLLFVAAFASMVVGCSSPETGVRLLNAHPFDDSCEIDASHSISGGSLDLSGALSYNIAFNVSNDLIPSEVTVNGDVIQPGSQNNFFVKQVVYKYSADPALAFDEETVNALFVIETGSDSASYMTLNLIQARALQTLLANVPAGSELELLVTLHLEGAFASGKKSKTNEVSYPIHIYNTNFHGCAAGDTVAPAGPCGNHGQDSLVGCCSDPAFSSQCT